MITGFLLAQIIVFLSAVACLYKYCLKTGEASNIVGAVFLALLSIALQLIFK